MVLTVWEGIFWEIEIIDSPLEIFCNILNYKNKYLSK